MNKINESRGTPSIIKEVFNEIKDLDKYRLYIKKRIRYT